jgi:predicted amidohydrolase
MNEPIRYSLAMGQMRVVGGDVEGNLQRAAAMIHRAAEQQCAIIVLPECLTLGWTNPSARELAEPIPGAHSDALCRAARDAQVHVVAGLVERAADRLYNAALLISPQGEILCKHRKINELDIAHDLYATGDSLKVVDTPLGTIGVNICADNFPNSLAIGHTLARMGAQILLSPSAWAEPIGHDHWQEPYDALWVKSYTTLAKLYDMTVVGVTNVGWLAGGPWDGYMCIGCSLAVGPGGKFLAQGPFGAYAESLIVVPVEILPRQVKGTQIAEMLAHRGYDGP